MFVFELSFFFSSSPVAPEMMQRKLEMLSGDAGDAGWGCPVVRCGVALIQPQFGRIQAFA